LAGVAVLTHTRHVTFGSTLRAAAPWLLLAVSSACTVDSEDGATSLGGGTVPGTSVGTTVGSTMTATMTATSVSTGTASADTGDDSESSGGGSSSATTTPSEDATGSDSGPDEQPADGPYSACVSAVECFGTTACVLVMGNLGFCTNNCTIPGDCGPSPAGTATPACVTAPVGGVDMQVCALDCSGGKTCPGGMECLALGASMVCV
jgi:hypothetical protein